MLSQNTIPGRPEQQTFILSQFRSPESQVRVHARWIWRGTLPGCGKRLPVCPHAPESSGQTPAPPAAARALTALVGAAASRPHLTLVTCHGLTSQHHRSGGEGFNVGPGGDGSIRSTSDKYICVEESVNLPGRRVQSIYMGALSPGAWAVTPHPSLAGCVQHLSCKRCSADRGKRVIVQWRDLTHTALAKTSRLIPTATRAVDSAHLRFAGIRMALDLCGLPPNTHDPSLILSKTSDKFPPRDFLRNTPQNGLREHGKSERLSRPGRDSGDATAYRAVDPWPGSPHCVPWG